MRVSVTVLSLHLMTQGAQCCVVSTAPVCSVTVRKQAVRFDVSTVSLTIQSALSTRDTKECLAQKAAIVDVSCRVKEQDKDSCCLCISTLS